MVGNVWQYTQELRDVTTEGLPARSIFALLKGGSSYLPEDQLPQKGPFWYKMWYAKGQDVTQYARIALLDDSYDRAGTVGFRCAADATPSQVPSPPSPMPCTGILCGQIVTV